MPPDFLSLVLARLDKIDDRLDESNATHVRNTTTLEHHVRRTDLLEAQIAPLQTHVAVVAALGKTFALVGTLVGILVGIAKLFGWGV